MPFFKAFGFTPKDQPLPVGAHVPPIAAQDADGNRVELGELLRTGMTYLYFFPKAGTPGCILQACDLRDGFARLQEAGIRVIGVSKDSAEAQQRFREKRSLPYLLLPDTDGKVARAFGVPIVFGLALRRSYLIRDGVVVWRDLHTRVRHQVDDLLAALPNLTA
ncbi:MAG: peroxiredoxin [Verrucomicrobium sp.]|nr:peroxiredoxin [Verrucomicrobium sp.]